MKFLTMVKTLNPETAGDPPAELMSAIVQLGMEAGPRMKETGGMALAGTITTKNGNLTMDGPFAETKEQVGGYAVYELETDAEMAEWARRFVELHRRHWPQWDGEITILQLQQFSMGG